MFTRHLFFKFFLFVLITLIASIITFSKKKKKIGKKKCYPRHGTLALVMEPSTLDPRQKDRLLHDECLSKPKGSLRGWLNTALSAWKEPGSQSRRWCKLCGIPAITIYLQDILALLLLFSLSLEPIHNWIHCYPKRKRVLLSQNLCCSNPCRNNAKCLLGFTDKKYLCVCTSGYTGEHCETGIVEKLIVTGHIDSNNMQWITKPLNTPLKGKQKQANQFVGWEF